MRLHGEMLRQPPVAPTRLQFQVQPPSGCTFMTDPEPEPPSQRFLDSGSIEILDNKMIVMFKATEFVT